MADTVVDFHDGCFIKESDDTDSPMFSLKYHCFYPLRIWLIRLLRSKRLGSPFSR